jgi:hypothetical protein
MKVAAAVASVGSPITMNDEIHCNTLPRRHPHLCPRHLDDPIVGGPSIRGWPLFVGNPEELLAIAAAIKARRRAGAAVPDVAARPSPSFEDRDAPDAFCASRLRHNEATGSCPIPTPIGVRTRARSREQCTATSCLEPSPKHPWGFKSPRRAGQLLQHRSPGRFGKNGGGQIGAGVIHISPRLPDSTCCVTMSSAVQDNVGIPTHRPRGRVARLTPGLRSIRARVTQGTGVCNTLRLWTRPAPGPGAVDLDFE